MAFGDNNPFGQTSTTTTGSRGGGGRGRSKRKKRAPNRQPQQPTAQKMGGGGKKKGDASTPDDPFGSDSGLFDTPFTTFDASSGNPAGSAITPGNMYGGSVNPLDTGAGSDAFNQRENYEAGLWGLLNQAGVSQDSPFGQNQVDWARGQVKDWIDQYEGVALTMNPKLTFEGFSKGIPGADALGMPAHSPDAVRPPPQTPVAQPSAAGSLDPFLTATSGGKNKRKKGKGGGRNQNARHQTQAPATTPSPAALTPFLKPGGGGGTQYQPLNPNLPDSPGAASSGASNPGNAAWMQSTFGPAMRNYMTERWGMQTPQTRGYDSTQWNAPRRVIQF